ncbi:MAG: YlbF family regulator [Clostridia bacterium]|nr:YlbF family regulator [Clostridia bacterium]
MNYDTAHRLAGEIKESPEYKEYTEALDKIKDDSTTMSLLRDYHKLQIEIQSMAYTGKEDNETVERFRKLSELLQMNKDVVQFLIAEYKLNTIVGDIYKIIAEAANVDLSALED